MRKARIRKAHLCRRARLAGPPCATALALVAVATAGMLLQPEIACAESGEENLRHITDSSTDRPPAVTAFPKYPSVARRDRIEGEAMVCFNIDKRGRVVRPSIRTSTHRIFERPAMAAIRRSSFAPLEAGEKPAAAKTCRTYRFRLDPVNVQSGEEDVPEGADDDPDGDADDTAAPSSETIESLGRALD